jgi:tRNA-specific 2-thiouridylase
MLEYRFSDKPVNKTRVVVAMSGGVDSSVAASAMHAQGYDVVGITLQLYDYGEAAKRKGACCAGKDIYDARRVAEARGFPHYVLNYEDAFRKDVVEDFADGYMRGETPVPCVRCNQSVKFRDLLAAAKDLEADALVTGHYVRRKDTEAGPELHEAADPAKDQSYFLFATAKAQLAFMHFPLGGHSKGRIRELATEFGLAVADKPDSQDICFVPNGSYAEVIAKLRPGALDPGEIVHIDGTVLGTHGGIIHYTLGQRKGIGIAWHEPLYVVKILPAERKIVVGPESALATRAFRIKDVNWLGHEAWEEGRAFDASVRLRSSGRRGCLARILPLEGGAAEVTLLSPERAVTPGQACVFYDGSRVLGGGWIVRGDA